MRRTAFLATLWIAVSPAMADEPTKPEAPSPEAVSFFESRVRPVLVESCQKCHGPAKQWSGLRLDSLQAALAGGESGPAVVPGNPEESLLVQAVNHVDGLEMPPKADKLPGETIAALTEWVKMGAPWPVDAPAASAAAGSDPADHWSFRPVRKVDPPPVARPERASNEIDAFLLAALEAKGLEPSPLADKRTLIRRVSFDLTGLPPTDAEVEAFLADESPDAYPRLVDRLLASPHYGERWARHWLDVARYADTKGYVFQEERRYPYAYTYRDWVVSALNADLPYDQFLLRQLAADKLPDLDRRELAAMGYLTVGRRFLNNTHDIIDDRIDVVARGMLGLTVACARCHDHKYDPIPQADYYSFYGIFASSVEPGDLPTIPSDAPAEATADYERERAKRQAEADKFRDDRLAEIRADLREKLATYLAVARSIAYEGRGNTLDDAARAASIRPETLRWVAPRWKFMVDRRSEKVNPLLDTLAALPPGADLAAVRLASGKDDLAGEPVLTALRGLIESDEGPFAIKVEQIGRGGVFNRADREGHNRFVQKIAELDATHPAAPPRAMVLNDRPEPVEPRIFVRGNPDRPGDTVPRRFLKVLDRPERPAFADGSGRLELARKIAAPDNPLTARVMVNRIWQHHFGRGIVATPSDFGLRGDPPSHPELLDWLAATFVERGWSVKAIHRLILLSSAYRQRSDNRPEAMEVDPENRLVWKYPRRRLDFESLRDAMLAAAGRLDRSVGGRSVELTTEPFATRRAVYGFIDRQNLPGVFRDFDFASPDASTPKRPVTVVPQQALFLMNNPFPIEQARHAAARTADAGPDARARIEALYRALFQRPATPREVELGLAFVGRPADASGTPEPGPWQYGYGGFDPESKTVKDFRPLPHFSGSAWQAGPALPDPQLAYLSLTAAGGHPGNDPSHAAIRRWIAPADGAVSIGGQLAHGSDQGDGVRARVVSSRIGELGSWTAKNGKERTRILRVEVQRGDAIDFVVDPIGGPAFDSFTWAPKLRALGEGATAAWDAQADFAGPPPPPVDPWTAYAQVLLLTNEFAYVD